MESGTLEKNSDLTKQHQLDALGNRSLVTLTAVMQGKPSDSLFQFTPPEGVDVIYALGEKQ